MKCPRTEILIKQKEENDLSVENVCQILNELFMELTYDRTLEIQHMNEFRNSMDFLLENILSLYEEHIDDFRKIPFFEMMKSNQQDIVSYQQEINQMKDDIKDYEEIQKKLEQVRHDYEEFMTIKTQMDDMQQEIASKEQEMRSCDLSQYRKLIVEKRQELTEKMKAEEELMSLNQQLDQFKDAQTQVKELKIKLQEAIKQYPDLMTLQNTIVNLKKEINTIESATRQAMLVLNHDHDMELIKFYQIIMQRINSLGKKEKRVEEKFAKNQSMYESIHDFTDEFKKQIERCQQDQMMLKEQVKIGKHIIQMMKDDRTY